MSSVVGLDTSVVTRLLCGEPVEQTERATRLLLDCFDRNIQCLVSDLVIIETFFALTYHYGVPKREAVDKLLAFLNSGVVKSYGDALKILAAFDGKEPGLIDRFIRMDYLRKTRSIYTFDKKFSRLEGITLL